MKTISNKNILVADDDESMLRALDKVLTGEGASVTSTSQPGDAVETLSRKENQIDLVITDLRMPHISGLTLVHYIRQNFPALPVIVLTAFGSPLVKKECENEGAAAFLEKPVDTQQLLAAIKIALKL
jgi:CheY-like chemotaxis protein